MKQQQSPSRRPPRGSSASRILLLVACALLAGTFTTGSPAAITDLSSQPLATLPNVEAKPNLMFILDDSGSMDSAYMPDDMSNSGTYGYRSAQCNGVAYDPTLTYTPPLQSDGKTPYAKATFPKALDDGYDSAGSTTDLSTDYYFLYNGVSGVREPKMGWVYDTNGVVKNTFYTQCTRSTGNSTTAFTKVTISTESAAQQQNYANWYSYYSKRYLLMRTAMGQAIAALDSSYRVGFSTISDTGVADGKNYFRDIKDFDSTQKANFYNSLYSAPPSSWTPLRGALSKAGRYYANKASGQTSDPVQYSCQRNYTLLSTDGYWNTNTESSTYGPFKLDGTNVGQQDGLEDRPMRDGAQNASFAVTTSTAKAYRNETSTQTRTAYWTRQVISVTSKKSGGGKNATYTITTSTQNQISKDPQTQTRTAVTVQVGTATRTTTVTTPVGGSPTTTVSAISYAGDWVNTAQVTVTDPATDSGTPTSFVNNGNPTSSSVTQATDVSNTTTTVNLVRGAWSNLSTPPVVTDSNPTPPANSAFVAGPTTTSTGTVGGDSNSLADVAEYYYATDLRTSDLSNCTTSSSDDVCANLVPEVGSDKANWQHMNTFTIGLGVSGTLTYDRNYLTQAAGSYADLKNPNSGVNWPDPTLKEGATRVDDLWHAAVNGRGQYYSALSASALTEAINGVVTSVQQVPGSASAASTSSLELVAGDKNQLYKASYTTSLWTGNLEAFTLKGEDATLALTPVWSAQAQLDATAASARKIYFMNGSALQSFTYANLGTGQKAYFDNLCSQTVKASQCATLSTATSTSRPVSDKVLAETGTNLVNYLRGDRTYESSTVDASSNAVGALYRKRDHVLGDIVNGAPVHVSKPPFSYSDAGYADFVTTNATRKPMVYVGANDGMLHAFSADTTDGGTEVWAYVPTSVMPNLYKLANNNYAANHQYFVDGAPVMADIKAGSTWKTILVGGFNKGGSGYYALDITDPNSPKALWEFTDTNLGLSFGNPVITKNKDGVWVVVFASGYNNTADGKGRLFVLDANTGAKMMDPIATTAGSAGTPSGLAKINAWIDSPSNNTATRFYGGDLLGNLWRFDTDGLVEPHQGALLLAKFQIDASTPQPITIKPETVDVGGMPVVVVATGQYLGTSDIISTTQQSIYGIKDPLTNTGWGDVRADTTDFITQAFTLTNDANGHPISAAVTDNDVDWATKGGWRLDLPQAGERVSSNLGLQFSTLSIGTTIPSGNACKSGGASWRYYLDVTNGGVVNNNPAGVLWNNNALIVGMSWIKDSNGNVRIIYQNSDGTIKSEIPPVIQSSGAGSAHRTSWRELTD